MLEAIFTLADLLLVFLFGVLTGGRLMLFALRRVVAESTELEPEP